MYFSGLIGGYVYSFFFYLLPVYAVFVFIIPWKAALSIAAGISTSPSVSLALLKILYVSIEWKLVSISSNQIEFDVSWQFWDMRGFTVVLALNKIYLWNGFLDFHIFLHIINNRSPPIYVDIFVIYLLKEVSELNQISWMIKDFYCIQFESFFRCYGKY